MSKNNISFKNYQTISQKSDTIKNTKSDDSFFSGMIYSCFNYCFPMRCCFKKSQKKKVLEDIDDSFKNIETAFDDYDWITVNKEDIELIL